MDNKIRKGMVLFTNNLDYEIEKINKISVNYKKKFYVYGKDFQDIDYIREKLPNFTIIKLEETLLPKNVNNITENTPNDFFALKYPRLNNIMDKNIDIYQRVLKGYKLVIENHPFLGKREVYWCYFLWSFFDRSLLGYPHCYAFQRAKVTKDNEDPFDCAIIANKISIASETTIKKIFEEDIIVKRVILSEDIKNSYAEYKKRLFDEETSPIIVVRKLKKFLNGLEPILKKGFNLSYLYRVHKQYLKGERILYVSDSKVDIYLEKEFWKYINNVNRFMETLYASKIK